MVAIADRCTVLRDGRVAAVSARGAFAVHDLVAAMTGRAADEVVAAPVAAGEVLLAAEPTSAIRVRAGEVIGLAGLLGSGTEAIMRRLFGVAEPTPVEVARAARTGCGARSTPSRSASAWCRANGGSAW